LYVKLTWLSKSVSRDYKRCKKYISLKDNIDKEFIFNFLEYSNVDQHYSEQIIVINWWLYITWCICNISNLPPKLPVMNTRMLLAITQYIWFKMMYVCLIWATKLHYRTHKGTDNKIQMIVANKLHLHVLMQIVFLHLIYLIWYIMSINCLESCNQIFILPYLLVYSLVFWKCICNWSLKFVYIQIQ